ncbi:MAG: polyprenyl synthetase family protein, partial [Pseudomonadota bacterium]
MTADSSGKSASSPDFQLLRQRVETRLAELVPQGMGPAEAARHSLLAPGKRLRAILTMIAAAECGGDPFKALDVACAVEMIHTASLVFDDLPAMDDASLRRGITTPHVIYGVDVAILAGIGLLNGAFGAVARAETLSAAQKVEISDILSLSVGWSGLVGGQALDLSSGENGACIEDIHDGKTGVLFEAATLGGAASAGALDRMGPAFKDYA